MIRIIEGKFEGKKGALCKLCSQQYEPNDASCSFCTARNYFSIICPNCEVENVFYATQVSHQKKSCISCQRHFPSIASLLMKDSSFREAYHHREDL
jgi:hypothetical protein